MVSVAPFTFVAMLGLCLAAAQSIDAEPESCQGSCASSEPGASALLQTSTHPLEKKSMAVISGGAHTHQDPDLSASGAAATLDEAGYQSVASMCCPSEAHQYGKRVVHQLGFDVCNTGDLSGVMLFFYCSKQNRTYDELVEDILFWYSTPYGGEQCRWIASPGQCKDKAQDCPKYTDVDPNAPIIGTRGTCCYPSAATAFEFDNAVVVHNNLGNQGPNFGDPQEIRYSGAGNYKGTAIELVVTAGPGYNNNGAKSNGLNGKFGIVSLWAGTKVDLTFEIQDAVTKAPVVLDEFYFSFLDLDEEVSRIRERVYAKDFVDRVLEPVNDLNEVEMPDGSTLYESRVTGGAWNNPTDPMDLGVVTNQNWKGNPDYPQSVDQRKQALMFIYRKTSTWKLTLEVTHTEGEPHQRNYMFGGTSELLDICPRRVEPTVSSTTAPPR